MNANNLCEEEGCLCCFIYLSNIYLTRFGGVDCIHGDHAEIV